MNPWTATVLKDLRDETETIAGHIDNLIKETEDYRNVLDRAAEELENIEDHVPKWATTAVKDCIRQITECLAEY